MMPRPVCAGPRGWPARPLQRSSVGPLPCPPLALSPCQPSPALGSWPARTRRRRRASRTWPCRMAWSCRGPADAGRDQPACCAARPAWRRGPAVTGPGGPPTTAGNEGQPRGAQTAFSMASSPGRLSRPLAPLMPSSLNTLAICQPWRSATACSSRRWLSVVCSSVEQQETEGNSLRLAGLGHVSTRGIAGFVKVFCNDPFGMPCGGLWSLCSK